jgi:serine O-acetyltransferase
LKNMIIRPDDTNPRLFCEAAATLVSQDSMLPALLGFDPGAMEDDAALIAEVLARSAAEGRERCTIREAAADMFAAAGPLFVMLREDVIITALRDGDPGGPVTSLLFGNGLQTLLGYRLTSAFHRQGRTPAALALKVHFLRAFGADIMPQADIGRRVWIDHGLGVVIGQTAIIEEDVSLWHGVTLGTNMVDRGESRHPRLRRGCILGAGAKIIGPVQIGEGAIVAAGTTVVQDVPAGAIAVGSKARSLEGRARPAEELGIRLGEIA